MDADQLKTLGKESMPRLERASIPWKHLAAGIEPDEQVIGIFSCKFEGLQGGCVVTDRRLLVVGGGSLGTLRKRKAELDLDRVGQVRSSGLHVELADVELSMVPRADDLVRTVNRARRGQAAPPPAAASTDDDPVEGLRKLASLHEAGILTDQEFTTKKAELLGRM